MDETNGASFLSVSVTPISDVTLREISDAIGQIDNPSVTAPGRFELLENADLVEEFAAVGITLGAEDPHQADWIEAEAAVFLRRAAECDVETDRLKAAMTRQIALVTAHYTRLIEREQRRYGECVRHIEYLASIATFPKKKKSLETPFGSFGRRDKSATVELVNPAELLDWAIAHQPEHVKAVRTATLADADVQAAIANGEDVKIVPEWGAIKKTLDVDGALPPGVAKIAARTEYFAAPLLPTGA